MRTAILRSLLAHKLRLVLSALAVVLGVAFLAGSLVFTDTLGATFKELFQQTAAEVTISERQAFSAPELPQQGGAGVPDKLVTAIRRVEGVAAAEGSVAVDGVQPIGKDGHVVKVGGAPTLGVSWTDTPGLSALSLAEGRRPRREGEIAIDSVLAEKSKLGVGDVTRVLTPRATVKATVVGVVRFGRTGNLGGASLTVFDNATAHTLLLPPGFHTQIEVRTRPGVSHALVRDRIVASIGTAFEVRTKQEQADANAADVQQGLRFINIFLLVFAFVALFVGVFIILNTFSILVAQRTRELALLRALGASRRQVTLSVLVEAFVVGLLGATVGLGVGLGLAVAIQAMFTAFGLDVPTGALVVSGRTVLASYAVGILVTMLAAYVPARRAALVPPVAAMRDDIAMPERSLYRRTLVGGAVAVVGGLALAGGLGPAEGSSAVSLVGFGVFLVLTGVVVLSPVLSRPAVRVIGAALPRLFGAVGRMSRENTLRNPRRTAATAGSLMIGLALVAAVSVLAASSTASLDHLVDNSVGADFMIRSVNTQPPTAFSPLIADTLRGVAGVRSVSRQRLGVAEVAGKRSFLSGLDPSTVDQAVRLDYVGGGTAGLNGSGLLVAENIARDHGWKLGERVPLRFQDGKQVSTTIGGIFKPQQAVGPFAVSLTTLASGGAAQDFFLYVRATGEADQVALQHRLETKLAAFPNVKMQDRTGFKEDQRKQVGQLLGMIGGLLALSIVIAVLGIVNTLALSVIERTREIGLLRAVGMSRRQLRRMVRWESVAISVFGALLGLLVGLGFGVSLQSALADQGIDVLSVPTLWLLGFLVAAALVGMLAAVFPAWRAARLNVLRAITTE